MKESSNSVPSVKSVGNRIRWWDLLRENSQLQPGFIAGGSSLRADEYRTATCRAWRRRATSPFWHFVIEPGLLKRVDESRFKHRFESRAAAIKLRLKAALDEIGVPKGGIV